MKRWDKLKEAVKNKDATTGVSSTITSIVPVLIIPLSIFVLKEKISPKEIIGAIISVIGVTILFVI